MTAANLSFAQAGAPDAAAVAVLRNAVAEDLTARYGRGHWSSSVTERGVLHDLAHSRILVARDDGEIVGVLRLATKKPWAIDTSYFRTVSRPLYLTDMAVKPSLQRQGVGRRLLTEAIATAKEWPADAIRLDAYDAAAGGGGFYSRCGFQEVGRHRYKGTPLIYFELLL